MTIDLPLRDVQRMESALQAHRKCLAAQRAGFHSQKMRRDYARNITYLGLLCDKLYDACCDAGPEDYSDYD